MAMRLHMQHLVRQSLHDDTSALAMLVPFDIVQCEQGGLRQRVCRSNALKALVQ